MHNENKSLYHRQNNQLCMLWIYYEEQDPERSFFMIEAFKRSVWRTCCLLLTGSTQTKKLKYDFMQGSINRMEKYKLDTTFLMKNGTTFELLLQFC